MAETLDGLLFEQSGDKSGVESSNAFLNGNSAEPTNQSEPVGRNTKVSIGPRDKGGELGEDGVDHSPVLRWLFRTRKSLLIDFQVKNKNRRPTLKVP